VAAISSQPSVSGKVETSREDLLPMVEPSRAERRPPSTAPARWIWIDHFDGSQSLSPDVELLFASWMGGARIVGRAVERPILREPR